MEVIDLFEELGVAYFSNRVLERSSHRSTTEGRHVDHHLATPFRSSRL